MVDFRKLNRYFKTAYVFYFAILFFISFTITKPMVLREIYNFSDFIDFVAFDSKKYVQNYEIHALFVDSEKYLNAFEKAKDLNYVKWHFVDSNALEHNTIIRKEDFNKNKAIIVYVNDISTDILKASLLRKNAYVFKTNSVSNARFVFK